MSPNTKTDGPAGDFVFGDAIIPSGVPGGQAIRAASIRTLVDYSIRNTPFDLEKNQAEKIIGEQLH